MRPLARCAILLAVVGAGPLEAQRRSDPPRRPFLFKDARGELAAARARGDSMVTLVVASMPGANARAAQLVARLGGTIRYREDDVDYLRVRLHVDSVAGLVGHALIHSADVSISGTSRALGLANDDLPSGDSPLSAPFVTPAAADDGAQVRMTMPAVHADATAARRAESSVRADTLLRWPPPLPETPLVNRYDPLSDMGAVEWRAANPTFDGRGTTIAIIDQSLDPLLPELQVATTLDGKPTRKIIGYETAVDIDDEDDGRWLRMTDSVAAPDGRFTWQGRSYVAPRPGSYRVAAIDEAVFDSVSRSQIEKDINRDGNPEGSSRLFTVLWHEATNDVWVDTDQDLDFADEKAYTDYAVRPEFGVIGTDKPETAVRESVAFAVQTDRAKRLVAINLGVASHASLVVGAAAASRGTNGRFDGVAPGAQLVNVAEGGAAYGQTEAVIRAAKHPSVDVIFLEQSSVIARNYLLYDGRLVPTVIYGRLIERFRKPIVIPTHNYAMLGAIDDYALAHGAISVGGHESKANFLLNHGVRVQYDDNLLVTGGYGPMGTGALKPDVIAPSNYVSTGRGFVEGTAIPGLMQLPPGYNIAGGTSTATPTTAGAVALLISAARQRGVPFDAYTLREALVRSARWVPHLPSNKQGNGVVNVAGAWEVLQTLDPKAAGLGISSRASVAHATSHLLATPNEGVGLFEREGWLVGDSATRTMTFTRTAGPKGAMEFSLRWIGNGGAFSAPATVSLPRGVAVPVTITVAPKTAGVHSAIVTLDHAATPGIEYRSHVAVVAAEPLTVATGWKSERKVEIARPGMTHLYYRVPEGMTVLRLDIDSPKRRVSVAVTRPDTRNVSAMTQPVAAGKVTYAIPDPVAGVWEVRLQDVDDARVFDWQQARKDEAVPPTQATVTVSALATDLEIASRNEAAGTVDVRFTNRGASFPGGATSVAVGSVRRERSELRGGTQRVYDLDVAPGSTMLVVKAKATTVPAADVDLYLFDCTGKECKAARADADLTGDEVLFVANPAAGKWKAVVDAPDGGNVGVAFAYEDIILNPAHGMVAITDQPAERSIGATWNALAHPWLATIPGGRLPFTGVLVQAQPKGGEAFVVTLRELQVDGARAASDGHSR